jgi:branched-chain amino acid transport system ATP-binding protein
MLNVKKVSVFYDKIQALHNISLTVNKGELVTVVGANGAGKTTLVKAIMGLVFCSQGEIMFNDVNLTSLKAWDRTYHGISYVPEGSRIFPTLSVEENLKMGGFCRNDKEIEKDIEEVYQLFPVLKERRSQLGGTLSGGEQQMLAIGRSLISQAKMLIIDEMSLGLMPILVKKLFDLIKKLSQREISILLIEQNAKMALEIAQRGYLLENGRVVIEGPSQELVNQPKVKEAYLGG